MSAIYTMGIDIGSTASKSVILKDGKEIVSKAVIDVGAGTSGPKRVIEEVTKEAGLSREEISFILATGYGRNSLLEWADHQMSELSCHAKGANYLFPNVRTVIDIGGQDAKVLKVGPNGVLSNFVMNDKCAAGTGRFLDVMAKILEVKVSELEGLSAQSTEDVSISSTCTVFAESEVISQLAKGVHKNDIIKGIHRSVAGRVGGLAKRVGIEDDLVMTGGVALNGGVVKAMEEALNHEIKTSPLTQYAGAIGAALFAYKKYEGVNKK
ncbi:MAG: (R)-2-hydroxyglutaryl-CoA dehydratase activase HgdC [Fusobacterium sp. JB021]|nr:(R)-2-hydroxyglutaryl-CoA dehydratase activase HgdC [Fusobacterium sp. JB020]MDP0492968.1 (R)-2-hydroxyglutaryl-CoA dehydratase activase HgdC [Fusobacterium sp. JB021]MDP0506356.1 (R)-2-hydroxyglutaryl-CoA dehydratase activase HgdC [Fusobacterium sp. JB019]